MKNVRNYSLITAALTGILAATGCNQPAESQQGADGASSVTETSIVNESKSGCCGKCLAEQKEQAASESAAGCCGKCGCAAEKSSVNLKGDSGSDSKGNCEKCAGKTAAVASDEASAVITCENGCNACAKGDSANCKCGDAKAKKSKTNDSQPTAHVNSMPEDRDIFHYLLEHHDKITRTVTELDNGVQTVTESTDLTVKAKIQEHVASMYTRVEDGRPLRMWDELYREIFKHADKIKMELTNTDNGVSVTETSDDEYVVKLIQAHAKVVTGFSERGFDEARLNHKPPKK